MEMVLAQTPAPKVSGWPSDGNFLQGHPRPAFSEKKQTEDQGKFFKDRPKSIPPLKFPKALWRKTHYPLLAILAGSPKTRIF